MAINKYVRKRKILKGNQRFRLVVFRSHKAIYGQIVDDNKGETIASSSSLKAEKGKTVEAAFKVGVELGEQAKKKKVETVWFDRNNYLYIGRVKALADGARKSGLKF